MKTRIITNWRFMLSEPVKKTKMKIPKIRDVYDEVKKALNSAESELMVVTPPRHDDLRIDWVKEERQFDSVEDRADKKANEAFNKPLHEHSPYDRIIEHLRKP